MALGDGMSQTNSERWSTNWALMKLSAVMVVRIRNCWGLQEKHLNMHNSWFINCHTNLHKSTYVHTYSTHVPVELFGCCHLPCLESVELCPAHLPCVCVCSCVYLLIIIPTDYSKDLILSPDKTFGTVTDKEHDEELPRFQTSPQSHCSTKYLTGC